ncbi:DUF2975 domain-containing protein [Scatolibacter rhodanostii]|uniref:DUF2975 domain-containing protein n=1 Tax=Scatolibacter rhodanostii TaxID=2014781 RepID=UPI000C084850|nr:DUF2975 domain-containing protein [Scatolibacter rhodanostii]
MLQKLVRNDKFAQRLCHGLQGLIFLFLILFAGITVISLLGRISINFHGLNPKTNTGYDNPILLTDFLDNTSSHVWYINYSQKLHLFLSGSSVAFLTQLLIRLIPICSVLPTSMALLFTYPFLQNIANKNVFVTENASYLFKAGLALLIGSPVVTITTSIFFPFLIQSFTDNSLSLSVQINPFSSDILFGAILLLIAYIFDYGIYLQNEVDSTL